MLCDGIRVLWTQWGMSEIRACVWGEGCVAFRHFTSVCHNVAFVDVCRCFRGFVFDVVIEFNFMVVLLPLLLFSLHPIGAIHTFLGAKKKTFHMVVPLTGVHSLCLFSSSFCSVSFFFVCQQIQVTVSSVFYYYHIMSSFTSWECMSVECWSTHVCDAARSVWQTSIK